MVVASIESLVSTKGWQQVEVDEERRLVRGTWRGGGGGDGGGGCGWNKVTSKMLVDRCGGGVSTPTVVCGTIGVTLPARTGGSHYYVLRILACSRRSQKDCE